MLQAQLEKVKQLLGILLILLSSDLSVQFNRPLLTKQVIYISTDYND